jgi:methionyl-tRNA formyltransferase
VPVVESADVNAPETLAQIRALSPDFIFVIGWSQICRREFLQLPKYGCLGYHPALLPKNRGRAVIAWTILQRLKRAGGSLFWLAEGVDTGDLLLQRSFSIASDETARTLYDKHQRLLPVILRAALKMLSSGNLRREKQDESKASYCARRTAEDGWIDWTRPANEIWTLIRAVGKPYPGAFTLANLRKLTVWSAELALRRPFWGMPGQIQEITNAGVLVQCGDREHVLLKAVQFENQAEKPASEAWLKIHSRLGADSISLFEIARQRQTT